VSCASSSAAALDIGAGHVEPAQLARDLGHAPGRDALDVHLGDREFQRPFAAQAALQGLRVEAERLPARQGSDLRHAQRELAHPRPQRLVFEAVRVASAVVRPFARRGAQELASLELHRFVQRRLHRLCHRSEPVLAQHFQHALDRGRLLLVVGHV
jgi:hypothetical protein